MWFLLSFYHGYVDKVLCEQRPVVFDCFARWVVVVGLAAYMCLDLCVYLIERAKANE